MRMQQKHDLVVELTLRFPLPKRWNRLESEDCETRQGLHAWFFFPVFPVVSRATVTLLSPTELQLLLRLLSIHQSSGSDAQDASGESGDAGETLREHGK